jgi:hypothetical protein
MRFIFIFLKGVLNMMNIVCIQSCAADGHMIKNLIKSCFERHNDIQIPARLEGRYVLAFDGNKLVGMADICGTDLTCVIDGYANCGVAERLNNEAMLAYNSIMAEYNNGHKVAA